MDLVNSITEPHRDGSPAHYFWDLAVEHVFLATLFILKTVDPTDEKVKVFILQKRKFVWKSFLLDGMVKEAN